jgi:uncharacterized protein YuzE
MNKMKIGDWVFDEASYDADADVLYLSIGKPRRAVGEQTPEGHVVHFDEETEEFCGVTIIGVQEILAENGSVDVTVPAQPKPLPRHQLDRVLATA